MRAIAVLIYALLVLLCYKQRARGTGALGPTGSRQQGQRGRPRTKAIARRRRTEAIECGSWRSGRLGTPPGLPARGWRKDSPPEAGPRGERLRSRTRKAQAAMHKVTWWWKPRQPRPS